MLNSELTLTYCNSVFNVHFKYFLLERVMGIEPTSSAWKAEVLPLNYTRFFSNKIYYRQERNICQHIYHFTYQLMSLYRSNNQYKRLRLTVNPLNGMKIIH